MDTTNIVLMCFGMLPPLAYIIACVCLCRDCRKKLPVPQIVPQEESIFVV